MDRPSGLSVRAKLALGYAGFLLLGGALLLAVVGAFAPKALLALAFLLVLGLAGGWLLAGRLLAPSEAQDAEQLRFLADASHELRTPLAITQALLDAARDDPDLDTGELIDRLRAVNTRAIDLTEALLLLGRAGQRRFPREHVDLSLAAEEATETLLPLAEKRGVTIETAGDIVHTIGSPALLQQVTTNLVHNAIAHNLPGHGTVWVTTGARGGNAVLTVENTGEKLAGEPLSMLVEPFQPGVGRVRGDHAGVGLGLAIVKSITQAHGGTLTLAARPTGGLRVTVELPAAFESPRSVLVGAGGYSMGKSK